MRIGRLMCVGFLSALAWGCSGGVEVSGGSGATSGTGNTGGTSTATGGTGGGGPTSNGGIAGVGAGGMIGCDPGLASVDDDSDGYTEDQGDCDDCDDKVNPSAAEVVPLDGSLSKDDDCDGLTDLNDPDVLPCDAGLALDSLDPVDAAKAIGFCDYAKFLKKATWVLADGFPPGPNVDMAKFHLGHGLHDHFGTNDVPREGERMLTLSSGTARNEDEPEFFSRNFDKGYSSAPPLTFQGETFVCPGVTVSNESVQDAAGLQLEIQTPSNATGFSFRFNYRTYEWPQFVCTAYRDVFWTNFIQGNVNKNIAFDSLFNLISATSSFITQCDCPPSGAGPCNLGGPDPGAQIMFDCTGTDLLLGTDFDGNTNPGIFAGWTNAGTEWLTTKAPVLPNKPFELRFLVFDVGVDPNGIKDHYIDSMVLIDQFRWHTELVDNQTLQE